MKAEIVLGELSGGGNSASAWVEAADLPSNGKFTLGFKPNRIMITLYTTATVPVRTDYWTSDSPNTYDRIMYYKPTNSVTAETNVGIGTSYISSIDDDGFTIVTDYIVKLMYVACE